MTDFLSAQRKILKDFDVPPSIIGMPDTSEMPKDAKRRFDRVFLRFMEQYAGRKLHSYEKKLIKAILNGDVILAPQRAGKTALKKLLSPLQP